MPLARLATLIPAVAIALAACASPPSLPPTTPVPTASATPAGPTARPAPASAIDSPVPARQVLGRLQVPLHDRTMELVVAGQPGIVTAWRPATEGELRRVAWDERGDIGLGVLSDRDLVLGWTGTICDVEATLLIADVFLSVAPEPRPACDAMAVGRGVVLTFREPVNPTKLTVELLPTELLPEGS